MSTTDTPTVKFSNLRRSQRVCLSVPVEIIKQDMGKARKAEDTRTLIVSAHGALLVLKLPVQAGELLIMKHKKTQEELVCRVINCGPEQSAGTEVGVEFEHAAPRFWRIAFPPADWSPRSPDAKPPTPQRQGGIPPLPHKKATEGEKSQAAKVPRPAAG